MASYWATCGLVRSAQKELGQLEGIRRASSFVDRASGKELHRPQLEQLSEYDREGDAVLCHSIVIRLSIQTICEASSRLHRAGRPSSLLEGEPHLNRRGISEIVCTPECDGRLRTQFKPDLFRERQLEEIILAKLRECAYVGPKPSLSTFQAKELRRRVRAGDDTGLCPTSYTLKRQDEEYL